MKKIFSIQKKILLAIILLIIGLLSFISILSYTESRLQDRDFGNTLSEIIDETNTIDLGIKENNIKLIQQSLDDLRFNPSIEAAEIYAYDGKFINYPTGVFASALNTAPLTGQDFLNKLHLQLKSSKPIIFPSNDLILFDPIAENKKIIGGTFVKASLRYDIGILNNMEIMILISMITIFIGFRLGESISAPLLSLNNTMQQVIIQNDYSIRARKMSNDEVGYLADQFNSMLKKIQENNELERISQEQIKKLAYFDTLTGLPNRDFFKELFQQTLIDCDQNNKLIGILYLDLDNFKLINDTFGHDMGDTVLQNTVLNIQTCLLTPDYLGLVETSPEENMAKHAILSRLSGDEFIIVLKNVTKIEDIKAISERIIKSSYKPYLVKGKEITITASIGISIYPIHGEKVDVLIKNADIAMYFAKRKEKGSYAIFNEKMNQSLINKVLLENELREALHRNELVLFYQPQLGINVDRIIGFEALLRWEHPTRGFLTPDVFISIAENSGLMISIGEWVLKEACNQCKKWHANGYSKVQVSVNLSPRQFSDPNLTSTIKNALDESNLDPFFLELEITEGMIMLNDQKTINLLHSIKNLGVKISVDDFGTGYSSLRYLAQYPIDTLKIDKTFIWYVNENKKNATLTKAIIDLAHNLDLIVIAEGVETIAQLEYLKINQCDVIQGYIISCPVSENNVPSLLSNYGGIT